MGYIYKVTNTVNGKVYVGQTTRDVSSRWKNHISEARYPRQQDNSILHKAKGAIWAVCNGIHDYCSGYHFEYCK